MQIDFPDSQTSQKPHQGFTEVTLNDLKARQIHESILIIQKVRLIFWHSWAAKRLSLVFPLGHLSTDWTWGRARTVCSGGGGGAENKQYLLGQTGDLHPSEETSSEVFPVKTTEGKYYSGNSS